MVEILKRVLIALGIVMMALVVTYLLPFGKSSLAGVVPGGEAGSEPQLQSEHYTAAPPVVDLSDVDVLRRASEEFANLASRVVPSVVSINTSKTLNVPRIYLSPFGYVRKFEEEEQPAGLGSGVVVSEEGHVITNNHVIDGVDEIEVTTSEGEKFPATVVGRDAALDIAVLKLAGEGKKFVALPLGNSDLVQVGETVMAVGNPFGLSETVTRGIISARDRQLSDSGNEWFQTDTVINPGNSGGPLVNVRGEVIGINVSIYAGQRDVRVWQGVGFAIPSNVVHDTFEAIMERGRPVYGYLGISIQEHVDEDQIVIAGVEPGSPADAAGLVAGDVVLRYGKKEVKSGADFVRLVARSRVGEEIPLKVLRGDVEVDLITVPGERPTEKVATADAELGEATLFGMEVRDFTEAERRRLGMASDTPGILVLAVANDSILSGGLKEGDIIFQINEATIASVAQLRDLAGLLPQGEQAYIYLVRNGQRAFVRFMPR